MPDRAPKASRGPAHPVHRAPAPGTAAAKLAGPHLNAHRDANEPMNITSKPVFLMVLAASAMRWLNDRLFTSNAMILRKVTIPCPGALCSAEMPTPRWRLDMVR